MPPKKRSETPSAPVQDEPRAASKKQRRDAIIAALRQCMLGKGYAETSLTDLAGSVQMSVSHLLYYYPTKEAVLLDLARGTHERILVSFGAHRDEPPEERIHLLVGNMFVAVSREEIGLLREIIAQSTHSRPLHANLEEFSNKVIAYLEDLFEKTPRQPGMSAHDAAELAAALWMGLLINSGFRNPPDNREARRLFRRSLLSLANLDAGGASTAHTSNRSSRPRRKRVSGQS